MRRLLMLMVAACAMTIPALAQDISPPTIPAAEETADATETTTADDDSPPLTQMILEQGGWPMKVILGLLVIAIFLTVLFLITLRLNVLLPPSYRAEAESLAEAGDIEALYEVSRQQKSAAARIVGAAARVVHENPRADYLMLRDIIDDEGSRAASTLWQRIRYMSDIGAVAPMIGLLGTVLGMIRAFTGLRTDLGGVRPERLADGVSQALITTAGGLIVGILAIVLYALFRGRVNSLVTQLEEGCSEILQRLVLHRDRHEAGLEAPAPEPVADERPL